jgi:hypothetical protein
VCSLKFGGTGKPLTGGLEDQDSSHAQAAEAREGGEGMSGAVKRKRRAGVDDPLQAVLGRSADEVRIRDSERINPSPAQGLGYPQFCNGASERIYGKTSTAKVSSTTDHADRRTGHERHPSALTGLGVAEGFEAEI